MQIDKVEQFPVNVAAIVGRAGKQIGQGKLLVAYRCIV